MASSGGQSGSPFESHYNAIKTCLLVISWYSSNILLLLVNKWLMSATGFRQPIFLTICHMIASAVICYGARLVGFIPAKQFTLALAGKVALLAVGFCTSIAFCMASYAYIPASFAQALGSTTPVFTAILALLIQGRREHAITYAALVPVVLGIMMASGGEPQFHLLGMVLQLLSAAMRALKTVLQAVLMTDESDKFHPISLLMHTSAASVVLLLPMLAALEPQALRRTAEAHAENRLFVPLLLLSCLIAFLVNWCNFYVTKVLGALTLQVLGNAKNVVAAFVAVAVFGNPVTVTGSAGYLVTAGGVFWYSQCVKKYPSCSFSVSEALSMPVYVLRSAASAAAEALPQRPAGQQHHPQDKVGDEESGVRKPLLG